MRIQSSYQVICRQDRDGDSLDVLGLNQFTLLIDRSQTALTEAGWNYWKPHLDGPPHFHDGKEQLFFAVEGEGEVSIAGQTYSVQPNDLLHVPLGAMHRTVAGSGGQAFLLINAFRDAEKEGKATFNDHVAISMHERRRQADDAAQGLTIDWLRVPNTGTLARVDRALPPAGTATETELIARSRTLRLSASLLRLGPDAAFAWPDEDPVIERILYGLAGVGRIEAGGQAYPFSIGTVIYVPPGAAAAANAGTDGCVCLSVRTHLD